MIQANQSEIENALSSIDLLIASLTSDENPDVTVGKVEAVNCVSFNLERTAFASCK